MNEQWLQQLPIPTVINYKKVLGGDINRAFHLQTEDDDFFLLVHPNQPVTFFEHEVDGLEVLSKIIMTPRVIATGEIEGDAYLLTTYIDAGSGDQYQLGQMVAQMHEQYNLAHKFGYKSAFRCGKCGQFEIKNDWSDRWTDFFLNTRLNPLVDHLKQHNLFLASWQAPLDRGLAVFKTLFADYTPKPSLLHGDLWAGNYMFAKDGTPYLVDPSIWYGDREFDIALTGVFGGYNERFYKGYNDAYPLEKGANARMEFYRLYYLMIHTLLFGTTYQPTITQILQQY